jgi:hypothetical protein
VCARFVGTHETGIANHVYGEDRCQLAADSRTSHATVPA